MRFWDSSGLVPLLVKEEATETCHALFTADPDALVWALTPVEILSALHHKRRDRAVDRTALDAARERLEALRHAWTEVRHLDLVRARAERLLAVHRLRAAGSLQLAAALVACEERPSELPFVSLDARLADAADREGFPVVGGG